MLNAEKILKLAEQENYIEIIHEQSTNKCSGMFVRFWCWIIVTFADSKKLSVYKIA